MSDYSIPTPPYNSHRHGTPLEIKEKNGKLQVNIPGRWTAAPDLLINDEIVSRSARLLGCALLRLAKNTGKVNTTQERLRTEMVGPTWVYDAETGIRCRSSRTPSLTSIQRWIKELEDAGWLTWRRTLFGTEFTLLHPVMEETDPLHEAEFHAPQEGETPDLLPSMTAPQAQYRSIDTASDKKESKTASQTREGTTRRVTGASNDLPPTPTERYLIHDAGFSATAAAEFRDVPLCDARDDLERRLRGTDPQDRNKIIAGIITTWRRILPTRTLEQRIAARAYDDPEVRAYLESRDAEHVAENDDQQDDDEELITDIGPNDEYEEGIVEGEEEIVALAAPVEVTAAPVEVTAAPVEVTAAPVEVTIDTSDYLIRPRPSHSPEVTTPRARVDTSAAQMPAPSTETASSPTQEPPAPRDEKTEFPQVLPYVPDSPPPLAPDGYAYLRMKEQWVLCEKCEQPNRVGLRAVERQRERDERML